MRKLCILVGMTVCSAAGWWLGAKIGFAYGYVLSGVGAMLGVYLGWRINRAYFE